MTVLDRMKIRGVYDDRVSRDYIMQLMEITPLLQMSATMQNRTGQGGTSTDRSSSGEVSGLVYNEEGEASEILKSPSRRYTPSDRGVPIAGFAHISTVLIDVYENLNELAKNKGKIPGLTTDFPSSIT